KSTVFRLYPFLIRIYRMNNTLHTAPFIRLLALCLTFCSLVLAFLLTSITPAHAEPIDSTPGPTHTTAQKPSQSEVLEWICPMECGNKRFHQAGDCPICHMALVPHRVRKTSSQ